VDAKEKEFSWCHAVLQEQLGEAQRGGLQVEDNDKEQQPQDPEPSNGVITDSAGRDSDDNDND